ncbi:hypothetical protein Tco_0826228 [Tanacetum coccineum]
MVVLFWSHGGDGDSCDDDSSGGNHDFYSSEGDSSDTDDDSQPLPLPDVGNVHTDAVCTSSQKRIMEPTILKIKEERIGRGVWI